jgi:uncharacterized protein RhaS with RHS repeats
VSSDLLERPGSLVHRYYDPTTGQFLSVDPLVDATGTPYAYADDDPVNSTDPTGLGGGGEYCFPAGTPANQRHGEPVCPQFNSQGQEIGPGAASGWSSLCVNTLFFEGCIGYNASTGQPYLSGGVGIGVPGVTASAGKVHGGPTSQVTSGLSFHAGGQYYVGGGYVQTGSCPTGEGARGTYVSIGTPGAGAFWTWGFGF